MAIEYINTLQGDILNSYAVASLSNLGQRMGAKGDSIKVKSFGLDNIFTFNEYDKNYVVLKLNEEAGNWTIEDTRVNFKTNPDIKTIITPIEYIGIDGNIELINCVINKLETGYTFECAIKNDNDAILYYIEIIITEKNKSIVIKDTNGDVVDNTTLQNSLLTTLPKYFIELYNDNNYFYGDYTGLNIEILKNLLNQLYADSGFEIIENNPFIVYLPKNLEISFYVNDNTGVYYDSLPITVKFIDSTADNIEEQLTNQLFEEANTDNYIIALGSVEKGSAYKSYLEYSNIENIIIRTDKLYSIPYIGNDNYWYINDIKTNVSATGKDAGNPNIIILKTECINNNGVVTQDKISVLHTYNDDNNNITNIITKTEASNITFNYNLPVNGIVNIKDTSETLYEFEVKLPNISGLKTDENISVYNSIIKNSLFFYIVDARLSSKKDKNISLQETLTGNNDTISYITVLFQIVNDEWQAIASSDDNASVLDLGSMISAPEFASFYTKNSFEPDNYKFSQLILDDINFTSKNNPNLVDKIYPIIKNDNSDFYNNNIVNTKSTADETESVNVYNNANITPKFARLIDAENNDTDFLGSFTVDDKPSGNKFIIFGEGDTFAKNSFCITENLKDLIPYTVWTASEQINATIYPMFDFREVITTNQTAMNRLSLISLASSGVAYNAYIGNSANDNEEGTLYIGSSPTNYSMSGNKTVTDDYGKFKKYNKINFELPVETNNLTIYKANDKYFTYINIADTMTSTYVNTITHTISTKYMKTATATYKTYTFKAQNYINSTYSGFINATSIPTSVELSNVTYNGESLPSSLLFIVNFDSYTGGKYIAKSIEQIASSDSIIEGITPVPVGNTASNENEDIVYDEEDTDDDNKSQIVIEE